MRETKANKYGWQINTNEPEMRAGRARMRK